MDNQRRSFLSKATALGLTCSLIPNILLANWPKSTFEKSKLDEAFNELVGNSKVIDGKVAITAPQIAEDGGQVRVEVKVDAQDVEWISILVEKNPAPLTSKFLISKRGVPHISTNIKVRETSEVIAIAKAGDKVYRGKKEVKVTAGGCA